MRILVLGNAPAAGRPRGGRAAAAASARTLRRRRCRSCARSSTWPTSTPTSPSSSAATAPSSAPPGRWAIGKRPSSASTSASSASSPTSAPTSCCDCFPRVVQGEYRVTQHLMFECIVESPDGAAARRFLGLNEVAIQTGPPFHMIELDLIVDGETVVALQRRRPDRQHAGRLDRPQPVGRRAHPRTRIVRVRHHADLPAHADQPARGRFRRQGVHHRRSPGVADGTCRRHRRPGASAARPTAIA